MDSYALLRLPLALALVIGLIFLVGAVLRRYGPFAGAAPRRRRGQRRLQVEETQIIDGKRRLLLIRRDNVEHLVLIGGSNDLLIEGPIYPATDADQNAPLAPSAQSTEENGSHLIDSNTDEAVAERREPTLTKPASHHPSPRITTGSR